VAEKNEDCAETIQTEQNNQQSTKRAENENRKEFLYDTSILLMVHAMPLWSKAVSVQSAV